MLLVGIDPGLDGGIAVLGLAGTHGRNDDLVTVCAMPTQPHYTGKGREIDVKGILRFIKERQKFLGEVNFYEPIGLVAIERVHAQPRKDKKSGKAVKMGAASMFNFGDGFGMLRAVITLQDWPRHFPQPNEWQASIFRGMRKQKDVKKTALSFVSRRYPGVSLLATERCSTPHKGIVDALCLMEYARRLHGGLQQAS